MTIRAVTCPGCLSTYLVRNGGRLHCSPCMDVATSIDDGTEVIDRNARGGIIGRKRSPQLGPQSAVIGYTTNGVDPGAHLKFGDFGRGRRTL